MNAQAKQPPALVAVHSRRDLHFVSGSRTADLLAFLVLACLLVVVSHWRLRVYHQVTVWDVTLTRVAPDQSRQVLETPEHIRRSRSANDEPSRAIASLERDIRMYMRDGRAAPRDEPGARFEWHIHYAYNSTDMYQERLLIFEADGSERR